MSQILLRAENHIVRGVVDVSKPISISPSDYIIIKCDESMATRREGTTQRRTRTISIIINNDDVDDIDENEAQHSVPPLRAELTAQLPVDKHFQTRRGNRSS